MSSYQPKPYKETNVGGVRGAQLLITCCATYCPIHVIVLFWDGVSPCYLCSLKLPGFSDLSVLSLPTLSRSPFDFAVYPVVQMMVLSWWGFVIAQGHRAEERLQRFQTQACWHTGQAVIYHLTLRILLGIPGNILVLFAACICVLCS